MAFPIRPCRRDLSERLLVTLPPSLSFKIGFAQGETLSRA